MNIIACILAFLGAGLSILSASLFDLLYMFYGVSSGGAALSKQPGSLIFITAIIVCAALLAVIGGGLALQRRGGVALLVLSALLCFSVFVSMNIASHSGLVFIQTALWGIMYLIGAVFARLESKVSIFSEVDAIFNLIDKLFVFAAFIILGGMMLLICLQVFFRYVMNAPLAWTEELARFGFIWMTFVAGYLGARRAQNISVELIQDMFPKGVKRFMQFISYIITAVFFFVVSYYLLFLWGRLARQMSPALRIHMNYVYLGILIGSIFMGIAYIYEAVKAICNYQDKMKNIKNENESNKNDVTGGSVE